MTPREELDEWHVVYWDIVLFELLHEGVHRFSRLKDYALRRMAALAVMLCVVLIALPALAHDSWISRGGLKNSVGEWCCGEGDCAVMDKDTVTAVAGGYHFNGIGRIGSGHGEIAERYNEVIPYSEVVPISPDGRFWRCKRPDKTRRCVFGPPQGY